MTTATVCFYTTNQLLSRLIRWWTGSRVSHCAIGCTLLGQPAVIHCTSGGAVAINRRAYERRERLVFEFDLGDWPDGLAIAFGETGGVTYDYPGFIHLAARRAAHWLGLAIGRKRSTWRESTCSEFVRRLPHRAWASAPPPEEGNAEDILRAVLRSGVPMVHGMAFRTGP